MIVSRNTTQERSVRTPGTGITPGGGIPARKPRRDPQMPASYFSTANPAELNRLGFRLLKGGAHTSRTLMLAELGSLLRHVDGEANAADYRDAVIERNALGKETVSSRRKTVGHLRDLYGLDPDVPVFIALRSLHGRFPESLPLLALLTALARDPLLRASATAILPLPVGAPVTPAEIGTAIQRDFQGTYSPKSLLSISQNCASSWAQAGHLSGKARKSRCLPHPNPAACVLAFWMGEVTGYRGPAVFSSPWCQSLALDRDRARTLGFEAHRLGLINLRAIGEVVELRYPSLPAILEPAQ